YSGVYPERRRPAQTSRPVGPRARGQAARSAHGDHSGGNSSPYSGRGAPVEGGGPGPDGAEPRLSARGPSRRFPRSTRGLQQDHGGGRMGAPMRSAATDQHDAVGWLGAVSVRDG